MGNDKKVVKIIGVRSDLGGAKRGGNLCLDAIEGASLDTMNDLFNCVDVELVSGDNKLFYEPVDTPHAKRISGVFKVCEKVRDAVCSSLKKRAFPLVVSGDHSAAIGTISGIRKARPDSILGVVWIGAHGDIHSPYTTTSGNLNGMALAAMLGEDNSEQKKNELNAETLALWQKLKNLNNHGKRVVPENVVYIGVRDLEIEEEILIKKLGIKIIKVGEVRKKGVENINNIISRHLAACNEIYISFDADAIDSSISSGMSLPVRNGFKPKEVEDLIASLMQLNHVSCIEISEVNPLVDKQNSMGNITYAIMQRCINIYLGGQTTNS